MPETNLHPVDHGAFVAVALSDGDVAQVAVMSRSEPGLMAELIASQGDTAEALRADSVGVPPEGCAVRLRFHRRGGSAIVTGLGSHGVDLDTLSDVLESSLVGGPITLPATSSHPQVLGPERGQAQSSISREVLDPLLALSADSAGDALACLVAAISGMAAQGSTRCVAPPAEWPSSPRDIMTSASSGKDALIGVALSDPPPNDRTRRELERHAPDLRGHVCSVTAVRDATTVKLVVRTIAAVDAEHVLRALTATITQWSNSLDSPAAAVNMADALRRTEGDEEGAEMTPSDEREQLLVEQVRDILQIREKLVRMRDNFFTLGGDSMTALQLATALGSLGWQVEVRDIFLSPSLRTLAAALQPKDSAREEVEPLTTSGLDQQTLNRLLNEDQE